MSSMPTPVDTPRAAPLAAAPSRRWPIRLWPAVVILLAMPVCMVVPARLAPNTKAHFFAFFLTPLVASIALTIWWTFASRARRWDRLLFPLLLFVPAVAVGATLYKGAPQFILLYALPFLCAVW